MFCINKKKRRLEGGREGFYVSVSEGRVMVTRGLRYPAFLLRFLFLQDVDQPKRKEKWVKVSSVI